MVNSWDEFMVKMLNKIEQLEDNYEEKIRVLEQMMAKLNGYEERLQMVEKQITDMKGWDYDREWINEQIKYMEERIRAIRGGVEKIYVVYSLVCLKDDEFYINGEEHCCCEKYTVVFYKAFLIKEDAERFALGVDGKVCEVEVR